MSANGVISLFRGDAGGSARHVGPDIDYVVKTTSDAPATEAVAANSVESAIRESENEIKRRGNMLKSDPRTLTGQELWAYAVLEYDLGRYRMEQMGDEILQNGGTLPRVRLLGLRKYGNGYAMVVQEHSGERLTLPCQRTLRQFDGDNIEIRSLDALDNYIGQDVTVDVLRRGRGYEVVLIGRSNQVLGYGSQATRLDVRIN